MSDVVPKNDLGRARQRKRRKPREAKRDHWFQKERIFNKTKGGQGKPACGGVEITGDIDSHGGREGVPGQFQ